MYKNSKFFSAKKKQVIILITIISLFITFGAYHFYKWETENIRQQKEKILTAIATLKIKQIEDWFRDELNDAHLISRSPALLESVKVFYQNPSQKESLLSILNQIKLEHEFTDVILTSLDGKIIMSTNDLIANLNSVEKTTLDAAIGQSKSLCTDLFPNDNSGKQPVLISFVSVGDNLNNNTSFALIVRMDPDDFLYPLVESWPVPSSTSETFIFRVENDNILYLNNLRHKNIKVLDYKIPLSNADLPAVKAAAGYKGIYTGKDYRNVDVFAYMDKIKDTPWYLISKIDKSEMFEELPLLAIYVIGFTFLSILTIGSVLTLLYNRRQKTIYAELYKKEKEIWQQQEKFKVTLDSLGEGVITLDINGKIRYMNNIAEDLTGWNLRESRGRYLGDIYSVKNEETGESENNILEKVLKHGIVKELANHTILISKSGKEIPVMDTGAPIYDSDGSVIGIVIAFNDETEKRHQQRLIAENEEKYRSLIENSQDAILINYNNQFVYVNPAGLRLFAAENENQILGKSPFDFFHPDYHEIIRNRITKVKENGIAEYIEEKIINLKGETVDVEVSAIPYSFKGNKALQVIMRDISERKLAELKILENAKHIKRLNRLLTMMSNVNQLIVREKDDQKVLEEACRIAVEDGKFLLAWVAAASDNNHSVIIKSCYGNHKEYLDNLILDLDAVGNQRGITVFALTEGKHIICNNIENDELMSWYKNHALEHGFYSCASFPIFVFDEIYGVISLYSDIKNYFEEDEIKLLDEVAMDIGFAIETNIIEREKLQHEKDLKIALAKAEEMNEVKTLFFANMSHELRTPFVGIMGYAELLVDELKDPEHNEMAQGILSTSKRMMETLTKILSLSKLEIKGIELNQDKVDLQDLFDTIQKEFSVTIDKKNLLFKTSIDFDDVVVQTDKSLLFDIIHNLVHNAVNYTNEGEISLKAEKKIQDGKEILVINVSDTGIGIPKGKQEIVWQEFRQVSEGRTRSYQGTGLGLTIVKKYTELLGGNIYLQSEEGKGSTFSVELPLTD